MTISVLNEILVNLASSDFRVNQAYAGDVYDINTKENRFGCFVATPMTATRGEGGIITYHYVMYYVDRLTQDEANMDLIQTDAVSVLKRVIDTLGADSIDMGDEYQFTLFRHNFDDWCAGAFVEIDFIVPDMDCQEFEIGKTVDLRPIEIVSNGTYLPEGFDGFSSVLVNVPGGSDVTKEWVETTVAQHILANNGRIADEYYNREAINAKMAGKADRSDLEGLATEEFVTSQGYLTEVPSDYAKKTDIPGPFKTVNGESIIGEGNIEIQGGITPEQIEAINKIPEIESEIQTIWDDFGAFQVQTNSAISGINNQIDEVNTALADKADRSEIPSLEGYATEIWVNSQGYLTEVPSDYAKKTDIPTIPENVSAFNNDAGYLTEHQPIKTVNGESIIGSGDIVIGGITPEQVEAINQIPVLESDIQTVWDDLGQYQQYINQLSNQIDMVIDELAGKADRSDIPSLEGYATETWVNSQGFAKKTAENDYSGVNKFEGDATYFGNYYNLGGRTYIQQNGDIYDKGRKLENKYALKSDIPTFKTINGESIVGEGNITIQGGGADLPEYIKDDYIEFGNPEEGENLTQYTPNQIYMHQNGYDTSYSELGFNIWNTDRELGVNASDEGLSSASSAYGSTWMGAIYMPGDEEPDHYGLQVLDVDGTHISELNNNGITFWDYDQTTEEGEIDWENPTITDITKEELIEVKNISNKVDRSEIWTGTQAEWDALSDEQKASYIIALVR